MLPLITIENICINLTEIFICSVLTSNSLKIQVVIGVRRCFQRLKGSMTRFSLSDLCLTDKELLKMGISFELD